MINFKGSWDYNLPLIEFSPYDALYRCRSLVGWFEVCEASLTGLYSVLYAMEKLQLIKDRLKIAPRLSQILCRCKEKGTRFPS